MRKRVWIGIPGGGDGPEKFANYFRFLRAAGAVPYCPDTAGAVPYRADRLGTVPYRAGGAGAVPYGSDSGGAVSPLDCDALLLPGGGDLDPALYGQANTASRHLEPDRDALEWDLLDAFTRAGKPVLGICRGMQSINVYFGGTLFQDVPGHGRVEGRDRLHAVRTAPGPFGDLYGTADLMVNSAHHQASDRLGAGLTAEQWTADGVVEAVRHRTLPVWGVQWHPERLAGDAGTALLEAFLDLCQ